MPDLLDFPEAQRFVGELVVHFRALLVKDSQGRGERKRRLLEVEGPPATGDDIFVGRSRRE